jgi:hypothetical protein
MFLQWPISTFENTANEPGPWSQYTKPPTRTLHFLNLWLWLLHKSSICVNNTKPTATVTGIMRHFITTTWIIRLLFRLLAYI